MAVIKEHWVTGLLVLAAVFLLVISVASFGASDPDYETEDRITGVVTGLGALVLLGGLSVRHRRARQT